MAPVRRSTSRAVHGLAHVHTALGRETRGFGEARPLQSRAAMKNTPLVLAVFLHLVVACASESSDSQGASGLSRSKTIASLSAEESGSLCDWSLETQGGPGKEFKCDETSSRVVHTRDECLEDMAVMTKLSGCYPLTVGEVEDCTKEEAADPCGRSPACDALNERLEKCAGKD
jgi:hypothetical protein